MNEKNYIYKTMYTARRLAVKELDYAHTEASPAEMRLLWVTAVIHWELETGVLYLSKLAILEKIKGEKRRGLMIFHVLFLRISARNK